MNRTRPLIILIGILCLLFVGGSVALASSASTSSATSEQDIEGEMMATHEEGDQGHGYSTDKWLDLGKRALNAVFVLAVLVFLLKKPLGQALSGRTRQIREDLESLEAKKKEAEAELQTVMGRLEAVQNEKDQVIQEFIAQGETEKARILEEAQTAAERLRQQARMSIDQEVDKAKAELRDEIADQAATRALELIQSNISDSDRDRLVDDYLKQVQG